MEKILVSRLPLTVCNIVKQHDYYQLVADGVIINVFNPIHLIAPIQSLIDHQITDILISENEKLIFLFENGISMKVSLLCDDYTGPEACSIIFADGNCVVIE